MQRKRQVRSGASDGSGIVLDGTSLSLELLDQIVRFREPVSLSNSSALEAGMEASVDHIHQILEGNHQVYGVTTCFGGLAGTSVPAEQAAMLQANLILSHKAGVGSLLSREDVRAAMLLRANALLHGVSGIRLEVVQRFCTFLNEDVIPHVHELGSIGASGDLVPLAHIGGALLGLDPAFHVDYQSQEMGCIEALQLLGLEPLAPGPKEGLALMNGTAVSTGIAANVYLEAEDLMVLILGIHALLIQALEGIEDAFDAFLHDHKPHQGQVFAARLLRQLLKGSAMTTTTGPGKRKAGARVQDRYNLRCLPQYMGPILEGFTNIARHLEIEMNAATDNPLLDAETGRVHHGGNFLAQYVAMDMDHLRQFLGLCAKQLDVGIAQVMTPEFSYGLPPSLIGNTEKPYNVGLKPLQIAGNSIMPLLTFYGNSLVDRFPTHAEQYNQNINSQSYGAVHLARRSVGLMEQYLSIAMVIALQAVELRTHALEGHYDASKVLSEATRPFYSAICDVLSHKGDERPYLFDNRDRFLDADVALLITELKTGFRLKKALEPVSATLKPWLRNRD